MTSPTASHRPVHSPVLSRRTLLLQTAVAGLAAHALVPTGTHAAHAADQMTEQLDALLQGAIADGFPGMALYVEQGRKAIYSGVAGVSSIELQTPLEITDRHRIYSITKTFTAIVTLQLVDEGVLSLDDTVAMWLDTPAVTRIPNVDDVTLRQLLVHTSGIYDFADDTDSSFWMDAFLGPDADWTKVWTMDELLAYADGASHAPYFAPGEGYHYSNTNYILIGLMIEQATGQTYGAELKARILEPLALADTFLAEGASLPDGVVDAYYPPGDGTLVSVGESNLAWAWAFGGMVSTLPDLSRFAQAVFGGELLSAASLKTMFSFMPSDKPGKTEGMGVYKIESPSGELIGMDGAGPGANSSMMRLEEADLTVLVLDNMSPDEGATEFLTLEVFRIVLQSTQ
jgi:D-alanyl-D-alanine carboxypeptidase